MTIASVKGMVAKVLMTGLAAGAFVAANPATAQAQHFEVGVQVGQPTYAPTYVYDRDDRRFDRDGYRQREEFREREAREAYLRRQAYLQHEQWERTHHFDRDHDYR